MWCWFCCNFSVYCFLLIRPRIFLSIFIAILVVVLLLRLLSLFCFLWSFYRISMNHSWFELARPFFNFFLIRKFTIISFSWVFTWINLFILSPLLQSCCLTRSFQCKEAYLLNSAPVMASIQAHNRLNFTESGISIASPHWAVGLPSPPSVISDSI